jgi:hypothetical protein
MPIILLRIVLLAAKSISAADNIRSGQRRTGMKRATKAVIGLMLATAVWISPLQAQDEKVNTNIGGVVSVPMNPTARFVHLGWGTNVGIGYNFHPRNSVIGEFMWNRVYATAGAIDPIRNALGSRKVNGTADVFAVTGNYRYELRGRLLGTYLIGGGGWYHRAASLSTKIPSGTVAVCNPIYTWWGYNCAGGIVSSDKTLASAHSNAFGGNGGVGFTWRVGEAPYRLYVEARYHYAPNTHFNTELIPITFGIRY